MPRDPAAEKLVRDRLAAEIRLCLDELAEQPNTRLNHIIATVIAALAETAAIEVASGAAALGLDRDVLADGFIASMRETLHALPVVDRQGRR